MSRSSRARRARRRRREETCVGDAASGPSPGRETVTAADASVVTAAPETVAQSTEQVPAGAPRKTPKTRERSANGRSAPGPGEHTYAALDLGTNNCRLLIAAPTARNFRVVDAFSRIVRLGEGLGRTPELSTDAMDRAVEALSVCANKMASYQVHRKRLIATEACRLAANGPDFVERVRRETGLTLEIVSRETEASLAAAGCASLIHSAADGVVVFDIGGGSTEIVVIDLEGISGRYPWSIDRHIVAWTSLPVGVVTMAEKFGGRDVTPQVFETKVGYVMDMLTDFDGLEKLAGKSRERLHLLGTSGTVTTIAGVHLGLDRYDRRRVDGTWMRPDDVTSVTDQLLSMTYADRQKNGCIGRDRADLVLAGCAIFEAIRRNWPWADVRVADRGLREGMLLTLMAKDGVWRRRRPKSRPSQGEAQPAPVPGGAR
ncbi:MAG: Ppx/GppA phosphatase family protein [Pseudomonadota bacterium]